MCRRFMLRRYLGALLAALLLSSVGRSDDADPRAALADVDVRLAKASLRDAEAELAQATEVNEKTHGAMTESELRRLAHGVERARLQVERAVLQEKLAAAQPKTVDPQGNQPAEGEAAIRKALEEKSSAHFVEMPLVDVVDYFVEKHKIQIQLDTKALDDAGVGSDTPVTRHFENISLRSLLNLLLRELDLTYIVTEEVLLITTRDVANQRLKIVVYDVLDLLRAGGQADDDTTPLIHVLTSTVYPTTWSEVGGPGSIKGIFGTLVVCQTDGVHAELARLLDDQRRILANRPLQVPDKVRTAPLGP